MIDRESSIISIFEKIAATYPSRIAICHDGKNISYERLNRDANLLADYLESRFYIKNCDFIGIAFDRSIEMIISIVAVLKTGAAYIAIDTLSPRHNLKHIIKNSQTKLILSTNYFSNKHADIPEIICLENLELSLYSASNKHHSHYQNSIIYRMYTSGSSGEPKGVDIGEEGLVNYVRYIEGNVFEESDEVIGYLNAPYTDLGYTGLLVGLLSGRRLAVLEEALSWILIL